MSVSNQAYVFLWSVVGGMAMAFVYDLFRIKRKAIKTSNVIVYLEDLIYWAIVALVMFGVLYYSNEGEIRGYIFIGTLLGVVLYSLLLSKIIMGFTLMVVGVIKKLLKLIWIVISYPFKLIFKVLSIPVGFLWKGTSRAARKAGRAGKSKMRTMVSRTRLLKNILKKF